MKESTDRTATVNGRKMKLVKPAKNGKAEKVHLYRNENQNMNCNNSGAHNQNLNCKCSTCGS